MKWFLSFFLFMLSFSTPANNESAPDYSYYKKAKIAVNYHGEVGTLLQRIANKLEIAYLSFNTDSAVQIKLVQNNEKTLADLIDALNRQLANGRVAFDTLGNRIVLVLSDGKEKILQQYIGPVTFDGVAQDELEIMLPTLKEIDIELPNEPQAEAEKKSRPAS